MFITEQVHYMFEEFNDDMYCAADIEADFQGNMESFVTYLVGA